MVNLDLVLENYFNFEAEILTNFNKQTLNDIMLHNQQ